MNLKIAIQMDAIENISIKGDSSFALMLEAQERGHEIYYYRPNKLSYNFGKLTAPMQKTELRDEIGNHFTLDDPKINDLSEFDVILMRQDPPFDMNYLTYTYLLELIQDRTLIVNNPTFVRNSPEKLLALHFKKFIPPTLITKNRNEIAKFYDKYKDIIIKPLYGNGGAGIFRMKESDQNYNSLLELFDEIYNEPFIVQKYLPEVREGDKRIILIDGKPAGAINRIPAENEVRSNLHVGGKAETTQLTERDQEICDAIGSYLRDNGLIFVGIDVIGDYLTEINVTSPTGIRETQNLCGINIAAIFWDKIEEKLKVKQ